MTITIEQLTRIMPKLGIVRAQLYLPYLDAAMVEGQINTLLRKAAFLAQIAHESDQLTAWEEYASGAEYEGRRDLGNIWPGDGKRFKGRGVIQLTGRGNYAAAGRALGFDLEKTPERAADIDVAFRIAAWFWTVRGLNELADNGKFDAITRRINGALSGKASRDLFYTRALIAFSDSNSINKGE